MCEIPLNVWKIPFTQVTIRALGAVAEHERKGTMSTFEKLMATLEATPLNERWDVLHSHNVERLAERPAESAAKTVAELRALGHNEIADAFENAAWEASFERHEAA